MMLGLIVFIALNVVVLAIGAVLAFDAAEGIAHRDHWPNPKP